MGIVSSIESGINQLKETIGDVGMVLVVLFAVVILFLRPLVVVLSALQTLAPLLAIFLMLVKTVSPGKFDEIFSSVQARPEFQAVREACSRLLGPVAANAIDSIGLVRQETRTAIQQFNGFSFAVVGAKGQGKSKFLNFIHQAYKDGTEVVESRPTADDDGTGITKTVFKIPTFLKPFGPLKLNDIRVNDWDVPGLFDTTTWANKLSTARALRSEMIEALKEKVDQTKWAFVLVIKVGGERLDKEGNSQRVMEEFTQKVHLQLDSVYKATIVLLTGLDDLIWPGQDELYAKDKFDFLQLGQLKCATLSWLSSTPQQFQQLVQKCGNRALLWTNRPERMADSPGDRDLFSRLQMEALITEMVSNKHGQDYQQVTGGCFPASATLQLEGRGVRAISELCIGDRVLTTCGYSPVYLSSHQAPDILSQMVTLVTESGHTITATPDHYIPLHPGGYKEMRNATIGDKLLVQVGDKLEVSSVKRTCISKEHGLYNPVTLKGDLIVNGVAMSCWSEWFLEGMLPETRIPDIYQAVMAPVRVLYSAMPAAFKRFAASFQGDSRSLDKQPVKIVVMAIRALLLTSVETIMNCWTCGTQWPEA